MQFDNQKTRNVADVAARIMAGESVQKEPQQLDEKLHPNQQVLDVHEPEKDELTAKDFEMLRKKKKMKKEEVELTESHFKVGDEVVCKKSGMEGEVVKVDEPQVGKYYTVKQENGKMVKYAPDELKKEEEDEDEDEDKKEMKEAAGASKDQETKFHKELDTLVHKTFGKRKEEMKEEAEQIDELKKSTLQSYYKKSVDSGLKAQHRAMNSSMGGSDSEHKKNIADIDKRMSGQDAVTKRLGSKETMAMDKEQGVSRQKSPRHKPTKPNPKKYSEEVEQVDEVLDSAGKFMSYATKAAASGLKSAVMGTGKYRKRQAGIQKAVEKAKAKVNQEETEIAVINADAANGVEMVDIAEREMTGAEMKKREEIVKSMKKGLAGFKQRYGDRAKEVMYATATKMAKKD